MFYMTLYPVTMISLVIGLRFQKEYDDFLKFIEICGKCTYIAIISHYRSSEYATDKTR